MRTEEYQCPDGNIYTITIGTDSQDNWDIIDQSKQNDIWFHVNGHPSAHVIISTKGKKKIHKSVINYAAWLCKENSKRKYAKKQKIIYTYIKNIKKADKTGSVHTANTKTVIV